MDLKEIRKVVQLVETAGISSLSIEQDGFKIEVKKEFGLAAPQPALAVVSAPAHQPAVVSGEAVAAKNAEAPSTADADLVTVKSPMVGTFYETPNPDAGPYVKVGDRIQAGQVICIVEAMKLFNEIESEHSGIIEKRLVENGTPVEYGQELYLVRKD
jgi:acetyl-CoA carboxylase biotin carboxyl carrier protein